LKRLDGDTFLYLNDVTFQDIEPDFCNGEAFENLLEKLNQTMPGIDYLQLINNKDKYQEMENWFIEKIKPAPNTR